jgi:hypothetical protein
MADLFLALFFITLICLIMGLISPSIFSRITKKDITRKKAGLIFGTVLFAFFILIGITAEPIEQIEQPIETAQREEVKESELETESIEELILEYEIIDEKEGETLYVDKYRYEVLAVTGENEENRVIAVAEEIRDKYQEQYEQYGDMQIYIFDKAYQEEISDYLRITWEESIAKADHYNKRTRAVVYMQEGKYSLFYLYDEDGKTIKTIENF